MNLRASVREAFGFQASNPTPDPKGGYLVPAGVTISQILDYTTNSGGASWPWGIYSFDVPTRETAVTYSGMASVVSLIAGVIAVLVTGGRLSVVDQEGKTVRSNKARRLIAALTSKPDGELPAFQWVQDVVMDQLLDGNSIVWIDRGYSGLRLVRCVPWAATTVRGLATRQLAYDVHPVHLPGESMMVSAMDIAHGRIGGLTHRRGYSHTGREGFAMPPVTALRPALRIGLASDAWIGNFFSGDLRGGNKARLAVGLDVPRLTPEQQAEITEYISQYAKSGNKPLVLPNKASFTQLKDTPQDEQSEKLRARQVMDVARYYHIPAPLVGEQVTEWGEGIMSLVKIGYDYGFNLHLQAFLAPYNAQCLDPGQRVHVDAWDLMRGDADSQKKLVEAMGGDAQRRRVGFVEEQRRVLGLPTETIPEDDRPAPKPGTPPNSDPGDPSNM